MKNLNLNSSSRIGNVFMVIWLLVIPVLIGVSSVLYYNSQESLYITVMDKERATYQEDSKYLIFTETEDGIEVFENTDSFVFMKFNSSDIYAQLQEGGTYCVKVAGWRVPVMSMYRNIVGSCGS